jgi:outer membrane protein with beta-barrel domain
MRVLRPIFAAGLLGLLASPALAQERYASVDVRAGYTTSSGVAKDSLKNQTSFGGSAYIALGDRLHLGLTADWAHHSQKLPDGTVVGGVDDLQWSVLHGFLKASFDVVHSDKITFAINAGPGLMVFSPNQRLKDTRGTKTDAHFAVNAGTTVTYWFAERIGIIGSAQADIALKRSGGQIFQNKTAMMFPITGGFAFKI